LVRVTPEGIVGPQADRPERLLGQVALRIAAVRQAGLSGRIGYISTAGGAFLEFLEGRKLPGVEALTDAPGPMRAPGSPGRAEPGGLGAISGPPAQ